MAKKNKPTPEQAELNELLFQAIRQHDTGEAIRLLQNGADPNARFPVPGLPAKSPFIMPLSYFALKESEAALTALAEAGADLRDPVLLRTAERFLDCGAMAKHLKTLIAKKERDALEQCAAPAAKVSKPGL